MIKRLLFIFTLLVLFSAYNYSQWTKVAFGNPAIDTLKANTGGHGATIDPEGKFWVAAYKPYSTDSVFVPDSNKYFQTRPIYVFKADGSPASFSPIKACKIGNKVLPILSHAGSNTGIVRDEKGNIILASGWDLYRFDYKTGAGLATYSSVAALTKPAVDKNGNIFVSHTLGGFPIAVLNPDMTFQGNAVDTLKDIGRVLDVSEDGNTIYAHRFTASCTYVYHRGSEFEPYVLVDTAFKGWKIEGSSFNPVNKWLYVSAGSFNDKPQNDPTIPDLFYPKATPGTYYGVDVSKKPYVIKDSLAWQFTTPGSTDERNRGIDFSLDGKTAILSAFGQSTYPIVQKYTNPKISEVKRENNLTVESYRLEQNYPNPFNPSTEIKFSVAKDGFVSLKVYDILGKEVATLVNETMRSGNYSTRFNAQNLSSGIYIYQLQSNGVIL
ncbi:MAG: T9SS type A sorting domain-containing protein, partial [Bacillota bacterium]